MTTLYYTIRSVHVGGNEWVVAGTRWYAELTIESGRLVRGCPCGRGNSAVQAIEDLDSRIFQENQDLGGYLMKKAGERQ